MPLTTPGSVTFALVDAAGNAIVDVTPTVPVGHAVVVDAFGNATVTGPPGEGYVLTVGARTVPYVIPAAAGEVEAIQTTADAAAASAAANTSALAGKVDDTDARLTDARTPVPHAADHATGGVDALTPASIGAAAAADLTAEAATARAAEAANAALIETNTTATTTNADQITQNLAATVGGVLYVGAAPNRKAGSAFYLWNGDTDPTTKAIDGDLGIGFA